MQDIKRLNSKLLPPHPLNVLKRDRLCSALKSVPDKRLTLVIAGAGYGKTTLLAQAVREIGLTTVWYSLDSSDMDFATFMGYLAQGIQKHYPNICNTSYNLIPGTVDSKNAREAFLINFLSDIEKNIHNDIVMVLDDYYLIQDSAEIRESLQFILERLPPSVHMVIISRAEPDIRISRLRVMREVLDIDEDDLTFTIPEVEKLFLNHFNISVSHEILRILHEKTGGWAAALILFYCALKGKKIREIQTSLDKLRGSNKYIFQYLEENIFETQSSEIKDFMLRTSLLSSMDTTLCDQLLCIENSANILLSLEENHLLTFPFDEDRTSYYYHHLLKDFLQAKLLRSYPAKAVKKVRLDIARLLEKSGDEYGALQHYLEADDYESAAKLLERLEIRLLLGGRFRFIRKCLNNMPDAFVQKKPQLQYLDAKLCSFSGKPQEAIRKLEAALENYKKEKSEENVTKCMADLGFHYYYTGDIRKADILLKRILKGKYENSIVSIEIITFLILFASILGDTDEADQFRHVAADMMSGFTEPDRLLATAAIELAYSNREFIVGDFEKSQEINFRVFDLAKRLNADMFLPLTYFQISFTCFYLGQSEQGYEYAHTGLSLAKEKGIHDSQTAWLYYALGLNCLGLGKIREAMENANESLRIFETQGNRWGMASAYELLHQVCLKSGDMLEHAQKNIMSGFKVIRGCDLPVTEGILETGLASVLIEQKAYEDVPVILEKAVEKLLISKFYIFKTDLLSARYHMETGNDKDALKKIRSALQIARADRYEHFIVHEETWALPLMVRLYSEGQMRDFLNKIFNGLGRASKNALILLRNEKDKDLSKAAAKILNDIPAEPPSGLHVHLFGKFMVCKGHEKISPESWKSSNALMIFKYLASKQSQGFVHKEVLMELLWPEEDARKTGKRLNVALSTLRKILEPELRRGELSSYLIRQKDSYRLEITASGSTDVENFLKEVKLAEKNEKKGSEASICHFLDAESCYKGPFLEEDPYMDWCIEERERLNEKYLYVLLRIIRFYDDKKDFTKCIRYANKYLSIDKYTEEIYRDLMVFHFMTGNNSGVIKTFEKCKNNISKELSCPLSQDTFELYKRLISGEN